ncbi:hypothetical protein [Candidatus Macondimonas diazotrophica]|jgi:hypothetical protein|uniref:Uncharacterized protein n=1 Tax=Candidatus Macondimonas diazotrophica TaxID=2305248 RepID=A0A4Z0F6Z0_9GAMM|nr:hypothetical protein [Candidatus Macondimonas diazotrophica]TFZ80943.1 hypothetical protein E4680_13635 [Candidatus Macondimonas diazotrophica]
MNEDGYPDLGEYLLKQAGIEEYSYDKEKDLLAKCPVEIIRYGHYDYSRFFIAVNGTVVETAWDCEPVSELNPAWIMRKEQEAKDWMEKHGILQAFEKHRISQGLSDNPEWKWYIMPMVT